MKSFQSFRSSYTVTPVSYQKMFMQRWLHFLNGNTKPHSCPVCNKCRYTFNTRKFYDRRCPSCFSNIFATQAWEPKQYAQFIKERHSKFQLSTYVDSVTELSFKHLERGTVFKTTSPKIARTNFKCPYCATKSSGAYHIIKRDGIELKARGKESVALNWILDNTKYTLEDLVVDSEGLVPKILYSAKK